MVEPISAFAVYKQTESKKPVSKSPKGKLNSKSKFKKKKPVKNPKVKGLSSSKILMGIEQNNGRLIKKRKRVQSKKDVGNISIAESPKNKLVVPNSAMDKKKYQRRGKKPLTVKVVKRTVQKTAQIPKASKFKRGTSVNIEYTDVAQTDKDKHKDPISKGYQLFEWIIAPMLPDCFFEKYWEIKPLHIARTNKKYFSHLLTCRTLDQIFRENNLHYTRNVDVVIYENEEKQVLNPEGRAVPSALWDFYDNGCSIRVLNPQTYNKKVHLLVSTLQEYFGSMVGVNVYLTPPGSQGFAPHFDDIEAFVIQLEGRKYWRLYKPKDEDVLTRVSSKNFSHEEIGEPFQEVTLEAGSVLYFPRGVIHEGRTDSESHSLHLTVSLYQNNAYVDLLEKMLPKALAKAAKSDVTFRKGLPLHFLRSKDAKKLILEQVTSLMDKLKDCIDVDAGLGELGRKLVYDSMPPMLTAEEIACSSKQDGDLLDNGVIYNKVAFDLGTKIRLTRYHCIQLVYDEDLKPRLYYSTENANVYHGEEEQWLELEPNMVSAIEALQKAYPFFIGISFLPIDGIELKIQFVYELWEKGIIITREPLTAYQDDAVTPKDIEKKIIETAD